MILDILYAEGDLQDLLLEIEDGIPATLNSPIDIVFDNAFSLDIPQKSGTTQQEKIFTFVA